MTPNWSAEIAAVSDVGAVEVLCESQQELFDADAEYGEFAEVFSERAESGERALLFKSELAREFFNEP